MKKLLSLFLFLLITTSLHAQEVEMADQLRAEGKIYVVVAVVAVVLIGLLFYIVRLDRKVSRLEREVGTE